MKPVLDCRENCETLTYRSSFHWKEKGILKILSRIHLAETRLGSVVLPRFASSQEFNEPLLCPFGLNRRGKTVVNSARS